MNGGNGMIIVLSHKATKKNVQEIVHKLQKKGYKAHVSEGVEKTVIGAIGVPNEDKQLLAEQVRALNFVENVVPIMKPFKLVAKDFKPQRTVVDVDGVKIGGKQIAIMAGPCAVEGEKQLMTAAHAVKKAGAHLLRGGAYKPRTSPHTFQGMEKEGLKLLQKAKKETGLPVVTEIMDARDVEMFCDYVDMLQIGARNMQNYFLLKEVAKVRKPVLLKRGLSATIEELLLAAEYIMDGGNYNVVLCERGIRTFEPYTRNTLDLNLVPVVKELSHLPVVVDPSHGTGKWELVSPMARASIACGADGLIIEVHPNPKEALSDGPQSLTPENFKKLLKEAKPVAQAVGRKL